MAARVAQGLAPAVLRESVLDGIALAARVNAAIVLVGALAAGVLLRRAEPAE